MLEITVEMLKEHGVCEAQRALFQQWLGRRKSAPLTKKNVRSASYKGLSVDWIFENVPMAPKNDLLVAACGDPDAALAYARHVEKKPSNTTREAACGDPRTAYHYAVQVDGAYHESTYIAACDDPLYKALYDSARASNKISECLL